MAQRRFIPYDPALTAKARRLRREATVLERLLWARLRRRQLGTSFRRQRPIGAYIVDFFAPEIGLVVEVDGRSHDAEQWDHDRQRQAWLEAQGLCVVRVANDDVLGDLDGVVKRLYAVVKAMQYR